MTLTDPHHVLTYFSLSSLPNVSLPPPLSPASPPYLHTLLLPKCKFHPSAVSLTHFFLSLLYIHKKGITFLFEFLSRLVVAISLSSSDLRSSLSPEILWRA